MEGPPRPLPRPKLPKQRAEKIKTSDSVVDALQSSNRVEIDPTVMDKLGDRGRRLLDETQTHDLDETRGAESDEGIQQTRVSSSGSTRSPFPFLDPPNADDELGRVAGYRVLRLLGQGGMGMVFLAEDETLPRLVALKVMSPRLATTESSRFLRESRAMAAVVNDHIIPIHQVGQHHQIPFLAMPFLQGESLQD